MTSSTRKDVNVFVLEEPGGAQKGGQEGKAVPQEYAAVMERRGSIIIAGAEEQDHEPRQGEDVIPDKRSRVPQLKPASAPLACEDAARPP